MDYFSVALLGIGLAMDAFSVSVSKGLTCNRAIGKNALYAGLTFGIFQGLMPLIGWFIGSRFAGIIDKYSGYVGFVILVFIGGKMIYESIKGENTPDSGSWDLKSLLILGVATSIDALAVGVTFATPEINALAAYAAFFAVLSYCSIIAAITFICSFLGFVFGKKLKDIIGGKAEIFGGLVLCAIGIKFLIEALIS